MTAKQMSFYKTRLREASRELFLEHDWAMPAGLQNSRNADPCNFTLEEWQQAKRAGFHARDLKTVIQDAYATSDGTAAFKAALEEKGLKLAAGRRGPIAVTPSGEPLLVSKYAGKKAAEVREKIKGVLPSIDQTKAEFAKVMAGAIHGHLETVNKAHAERMAPLANKRSSLSTDHRAARQKLDSHQQQKQRDDLIATQLLDRQRLQTQIDQARKDHLRQTQDLHRDLSRFKEGDLSAFKPVDRTGGVHERLKRPKADRTQEPAQAPPEPARAPPEPKKPDHGLSAQHETLKPAWQQVTPSPQERLEALRNQAVETGSVEKSREERLAVFKE